jgi:DtxR family Mn-dependent transcriptional regulator
MAAAPQSSPHTAVIEDYLKVIYAHTEWQPDPITSGELAQRLGLAPSTVTEMVKKLVARDLVEHERYGAVTLTAAGRAEALRMIRRHRLIETWLVRQFGYGWDEVHDEAEVLEHAISDRLLDAIDAALGAPTADPHGDPIPDAQGRVAVPEARRADAEDVGEEVVVIRISDRDPETLRDLDRSGITVGSTVTAAALGRHASAVWVASPTAS